ncbi:MAG: tRNA (adenosine(37)-N6)-dimethylallyltransferase MiaA [Leptospirales bacterium]|nr:tRNA (adenosine(37)-N6)-dimethylallyltransferase MiaA [Leptospirales bacterium]
MKKFNLLAICGPTASSKTSLAVKIASKYNGEIISCDSRQVFIGMDIGTGKDLEEYKINPTAIKYHLIDIVDPVEDYNLYRYIYDFKKAFNLIQSNDKLPILTGGSGLYLEAALKNYNLYPAPQNNELRTLLNTKTKDQLIDILKSESLEIYKKTDLSSTRRIIRGIEIAQYINNNQLDYRENNKEDNKENNKIKIIPLIIGIRWPRDILIKKIDLRLEERLQKGMIDEVKELIARGVTIERLIKFGLEYKYCALYLSNEISYTDMVEKLKIEIHKYSKRQMTWLRGMERRGLKINWIKDNKFNYIEEIINNYL